MVWKLWGDILNRGLYRFSKKFFHSAIKTVTVSPLFFRRMGKMMDYVKAEEVFERLTRPSQKGAVPKRLEERF